MAPSGTMDPRETTEGVMEGQTSEMERGREDDDET